MKAGDFKLKAAIPGNFFLLALLWLTLPAEPVLGNDLSPKTTPLYLAQAPQLSVQDIEKQIEGRLDKVWKALPSLPAGAGAFDFIINKDGSLANLIPVKPSGNADFDRAAMGTIKRVIPLPNLPAHLAVDSMRLRASFQSGQFRKVALEFAPLSFDGGEPPTVTSPPAHKSDSAGPTAQIKPPSSRPQAKPPAPDTGVGAGAGVAAPQTQMSPQEKAQTLYKLVNLGVVSMNAGNYKTAISKLEEAIALAPDHSIARQNLAIAYNNYGLTLKDKPAEALKIYHKAVYLNPESVETVSNLEAIITMLGKNPTAFEDRVKLADSAARAGDKLGAKVEYMAALKLKEDASVRSKLGNLDKVQAKPPETSRATPPPKQAAKPQSQKTPPATNQKKPGQKTAAPSAPPAKSPPKSSPLQAGNKLDEVYRHLSALEKKLFGKVFAQDDLISRLNRLENKSFGKPQTGSTKRRLDALLLAN